MKKRILAGLVVLLGVAGPLVFLAAETQLAASENFPNNLNGSQAKWMEMEKSIRKKVAAFRGEVGLVIKDLATGRTLQINPDRLFPSASMVKVPIMVSCLKAAAEGRFSLQDKLVLLKSSKARGSGVLRRNKSGTSYSVEELIELMITHSDNTAANMLIDRLGFDYLAGCFKAEGLSKTNLSRKMMDFRARTRGVENYTTAREMAEILEKIYRNNCVCPAVSEKCLALLKLQKVNDRIPRLLPNHTVVAHKTGLERQVCHDAGVVFMERGDILISIFTRTTSGSRAAKRFIAAASSLAYKACRETVSAPMAGFFGGQGKAGR